MSIIQNRINSLEREIAELQKKIVGENEKEITKIKQIDSIERSINKNTSSSTLQNKNRQIQRYQSDILKYKKTIAEIHKKIATKSSELTKKKQDLKKEENYENAKVRREQLNFQKQIENDINNQKKQLDFLINMNYKSTLDTTNKKDFDFFISHASEDKDEFVRDFAANLIESGFTVWYDEFELKIGDSLRRNIDKGLGNSRYGIVIISPSFIKKNWTEYELNGMVAREMNGHKVILPIWHKISIDEVLKYSPSLADKLAFNTSIHSIKDIIKALKDL